MKLVGVHMIRIPHNPDLTRIAYTCQSPFLRIHKFSFLFGVLFICTFMRSGWNEVAYEVITLIDEAHTHTHTHRDMNAEELCRFRFLDFMFIIMSYTFLYMHFFM